MGVGEAGAGHGFVANGIGLGRVAGNLSFFVGVATFVAVTAAAAGPAVNQFELKDLDAEPGRVQLQSQNAHSFGQPDRKIAFDDDGPVLDDNSVIRQRHALEMELSLSHFFRLRLGVEFEKERLEEPDDLALANAFDELKFEEVAIEGVTIFSRVPEAGGVGVGMLAEVQFPVGSDDLNSIVIGPIFEAKSGRWAAVANITFVQFFGNGERGGPIPERDNKLDLAYAGQVSYAWSDAWNFAVEAYGTFDRLGNSGMPGEERAFFGDHDLHRVGPLVYYTFDAGGTGGLSQAAVGLSDDHEGEENGVEVSIGTGVLFGLNENTPDATLKWSVEVEF